MTTSGYPQPPPTKASLKSWWNHFLFAQRAKKEAEQTKGEFRQPISGSSGYRHGPTHPLNMPGATGQNVVFGKPLKESLKYANVQISTANANGELYVWGYIPVVVAKWYVPFYTARVHELIEAVLRHLKKWALSEGDWCVDPVIRLCGCIDR